MNVEIIKNIRAAIVSDDPDRVEVSMGAEKEYLNERTVFGTWLHEAANENKVNAVRRLIAMGIDIDANGGIGGGAALDRAAAKGHALIVNYLLDAGAKIDVSEPERNPLFGAIYGGHLEIVKLLVERGIDIHVVYNGTIMKNMDALAFARERGQKEIANYLASLRREPGS